MAETEGWRRFGAVNAGGLIAARDGPNDLAGDAQPQFDLVHDWDFSPSPPPALVRAVRLRSLLRGWSAAPRWKAIRSIAPTPRWNFLFLFVPDGHLDHAQTEIVSRVRRLNGAMAVVIACRSPDLVPASALGPADAIYWKDLGGYDFSAYALALTEVARLSPGALLYLQNDSVLGPFDGADQLIDRMRWGLGGFMASSAFENHLQSYALVIQRVDQDVLDALRPVLSTDRSLNSWRDVVALQETRLARLASRSMTVGALWFAPHAGAGTGSWRALANRLGRQREWRPTSRDPSLVAAARLLDEGFPFLKRSLLSRNAHLHDPIALRSAMEARGLRWPGAS